MKKCLSIILCAIMLLSLCACKEETENNKQEYKDVKEKKTEITVDEFIKTVDGIWVDLGDFSKTAHEGVVSFSFIKFEQGSFCTGEYPGSFGRLGEITDVKQDDNLYTVKIYYSAGYNYDDYVEEEYKELEFEISGNEMKLNEDSTTWTKMGSNMTDTIENVTRLYDESNTESAPNKDSLPYVNISSSYLGNSYSKLKAKGNIKYEVPVSGDFLTFIRDTADDGIDYNVIGEQTYIGVQGDTIVGFVQYGYPTNTLVNNWIQQDAFYDNPPKIVENGDSVFLGWQINNGYLVVSAYPTNNNGEWYNYRPSWIININSLEQCNIDW